jgi:hypothetical protein
MDEHSKIELETVQNVTLISCEVSEVFMEFYLASAHGISPWRLSYPERGATEWSEANPWPPVLTSDLRFAPSSISGGSKVELRRPEALRQEIGR